MFRNQTFPAAAVLLLVLAANATAQNVSAAASSPGPVAEAVKPTLRVQLVINRFEGEKKIGSLPYAFVVVPNSNPIQIRFGVEVPVPMAGLVDQGMSGPVQYKSMGTNIDCRSVTEVSAGRYVFDINLQNTAALPGVDADGKGSRPLFRSFDARFTAVLRDGQTMQTIASTNPVTGEVVKIDVTMNIVR